jgi:hypothetical protein
MWFSSAGSAGEPDFKTYAFGVSFTWNAAPRVGLESEAGFGIAGRESMSVAGQVLAAQAVPDTMGCFESVVFYPIARRHAVAPYVNAGIGAFRLLKREGTAPLGISDNRTFLAGAFGGGVRWHVATSWGLRGDYRLIAAAPRRDAAAFFGRHETRYGHRLSAAIFTTF